MIGLTAPPAALNRAVIDAEGYPVARPRRADSQAQQAGQHAPQVSGRAPRAANVLAFAQRVGQRQDQDHHEPESAFGAWREAARANYPVSTFLAQHYAQEDAQEGLATDPYASAAGAYARTEGLSSFKGAELVSIAV